MIKDGEMLTLNDNKVYSVAFSTIHNQKNYVFLIDQDDYTNTMFCEYDSSNGLVEVVDTEIIEQLLLKFADSKN